MILTDEEIDAVWPAPEGTNSMLMYARAIEARIMEKLAERNSQDKLDAERLDFVTTGTWFVRWKYRHGEPKKFQMIEDGEPWGKWHKTPREAIDAAMKEQGK